MDSTSEPTTTKYQQVTVDVPEDRIAEFHAFFGRFLAATEGRGRRGRHGRRHHHRSHGHGCGPRAEFGERGESAERGDSGEQAAETTEV